MRYDKDQIKENLTLSQIQEACEKLGASVVQRGAGTLVMDTICHNLPGEGSKKLYYYDNTKLFRCYTDCGEYFDIFELVVKAKETQFSEEWELPRAVAFIAQMFGLESLQENGFATQEIGDWAAFKIFDRLHSTGEGLDKKVTLKEYDSSILKNLPKPSIEPWLKEGISKESMIRYDIGYYPAGAQITIPHLDENGRFIGLRGRTLVKEDGVMYGKYMPLILSNGFMFNHPLGFSLYGLDKNKKNISLSKKAIVFEGEKAVLLYDTYFGFENNISVACCGSSISSHQFDLLISLGVQEVIIAFDRQFKDIGDKEFKKQVENIKRVAEKGKRFTNVSCIFDKKGLLDYKSSPIDHGKEVFIELLNSRINL